LTQLKDHIADIAEKIGKGRVVLFLGAGASASAGAPQQKDLVEAIKKKFPKIDDSKSSLIDVCQDFVETKGYNLKDLEDFITQKLSGLKPTKTHFSLTKYSWPVIFTTNFDDLIETAYRTSDNALKPCFVVDFPSETPIVDTSKIYLFKIMGTIATRLDNKMVLCRSDFVKMMQRRTEYLRHLEDYVKDGTIVFIGYGAGDRIVTDIIDEVKDKIGLQRLPWSYLLLKDLNFDEKDNYRFETHKMLPIKCTFEEFFEELEKTAHLEYEAPISRPKGERIRVKGIDIFISTRDLESYQDYFEILYEGLIPAKAKSKEDFFKGAINDYGCYAEDFDFKREVYLKPEQIGANVTKPSLKDKVFFELKETDLGENKIILVTGAPGVGKSVLLRRLAYDVYTSGTAPVILFDRTKMFFDYKLLSNILVDLDRKFDEASEGKEHRLKPLIIIDDPSVDTLQLKDYLSSRGRVALIVIASRDNELFSQQIAIPSDDVYRIKEFLSVDEKKGISEHFFKIGVTSSPDENWDLLIDRESEYSFFATVYTLVQPARKPLNEIIYDQYSKLNPRSKQAFSYICLFHQFDLPINLELLVRALKCSYEEFYNEILTSTKGLIFEESVHGYLLYTTHHRIIARKTIDFFFTFTKRQKELFLEMLSDINMRNGKERELIQKLLINYLRSESKSTDLNRLDKIEIFQKVCSQYETKALLHHLGVLLSDEGGRSEEAGAILKRALTIHEGGRTSQRTEIDQNILTSLGVLHSRLAVSHFQEKFAHAYVEQQIKMAENYFTKARFGGWPNAHSYHAHANMFVHLGDLVEDDGLHKTNLYASALSILQDARDNLNDDQLQMIDELEMSIYQRIGKTEISLEKAAQIAEKYNSARGYTLFASTLVDKSRQLVSWPDREPLLKRAMSIVDTALEKFPHDENALALKAKLTRRLFPLDNNKYFESLQTWYNNAKSPNIWLLFELGVSAFKEKQYEYSRRTFGKLENEQISGGIRRRYVEQVYLGPDRKPLHFVGVIVSIEGRYDGYIRCETLNELNYPLPFRPIGVKFQPAEGDMVDFCIAFDFRGPRAIRINRI
jgi:hypothetical protein